MVKAAKAGGMCAYTEQLVPQFPRRWRRRKNMEGEDVQVEEDAIIDVEAVGVHEACELLMDASIRHPRGGAHGEAGGGDQWRSLGPSRRRQSKEIPSIWRETRDNVRS